MKQDDKSDVLVKIEQALESMKKRLYEIKKEDNPNLDWDKFSKNFDSMKDVSDAMLKNKLFQEEMDKLIELENDINNRRLLAEVKDTIDFVTLPKQKKMYFPSFLTRFMVLFMHFIVSYLISLIVFGMFSSFLCLPVWYVFVLSPITAILFMICDLPSKSIKVFMYDPFLSYKLLVVFTGIMIFINQVLYQIFDSSIIWLLFIVIAGILIKITNRFVHRIWWRY